MSGVRFNIINKIKTDFDFDTYLDQHFVVKRTEGPELRVCCPKCADGKYKLYVNDDKKLFHCFKCDFSSKNYDVFDFVAITENISRGIVMLRLANEYVEITPVDAKSVLLAKMDHEEADTGRLPVRTIEALPANAHPLKQGSTELGMKYLKGRGLTEQEILDAGTHYVSKRISPVYDSQGKRKGNIGNRVIFPVYGGDNALVSWISRAIITREGEPKFLNAPEAEQSRTLWPYVPSHENHVIIVEGILDCIAVRRLGAPYSAYATFGKHMSEDQLVLLKEWGVTSVTLFWDQDAKRNIKEAVEDLKMHFDEVYVANVSDWPKDQDAGDVLRLPYEEGVSVLKKALVTDRVDVNNSLEYAKWQVT